MKKSIFYLLFIFLTLSCGGPDDGPPQPPPVDPIGMGDDTTTDNESTTEMITLNFEGITSLVYDDIEVVSVDGFSQVSSEGVFENTYQEREEEIPVIFVKNDELLFGYFPSEENSKEITNEDLLEFFVKSFPGMQLRQITNENIAKHLREIESSAIIYTEMIASLNNNNSPFENGNFNESFLDLVQKIIDDVESSNKSKEIVGEFKFDYGRDGHISWPSEVPLFAGVGIEITNDLGQKIDSAFLQPKSIGLAAVIKSIFSNSNNVNTSYQIQEDGTYNIDFTNGTPFSGGISYTDRENYKILTSKAIGFVLPAGFGYFSRNSVCFSAMSDVFSQGLTNAAQMAAKGSVSSEDLIDFVKNLGFNLIEFTGACGGQYVTLLAGWALKVLSLAFEIGEFLFFSRDFFASNISGNETRFFSNGISFGELKITDESEKEFSGIVADEFQYSKIIMEEVTIYEIDRGVLSSSFNKDVFDDGAKDLPFKYEIVSGDALVVNDPIFKTEFDGTLNFNMTIGNEDSEILLYPDFESTVIDNTTINLTNLENDVLLIEGNFDFGDVPINQTKEEVFTITNRSDNVMTIDFISTPDGFDSAFSDPNAPLIVIEPQESTTTVITFKPTTEMTYGGTITFSNNVFQENNSISVTGNGIEENNEVDLSGVWRMSAGNNGNIIDCDNGGGNVITSRRFIFNPDNTITFTTGINSLLESSSYSLSNGQITIQYVLAAPFETGCDDGTPGTGESRVEDIFVGSYSNGVFQGTLSNINSDSTSCGTSNSFSCEGQISILR